MGAYRRRHLLQTGALVGLGSLLSRARFQSGIAQDRPGSPTWGEQLQIAFLLGDDIKDFGWSYSHDRARRQLVRQLGSAIVAVPIEQSPQDHPETERLLRHLMATGYRLVFDTRVGAAPLAPLAAEFPELIFLECGGETLADNLGTYAARMAQPRYLTGMVAAAMSQSHQLGFVASQPHAEVIREINAFTLGAQSLDPEVRVQVAWMPEGYDPSRETQLGQDLIAAGCDVLSHHTDSPQIVQLAQEAGVFAMGYHSDMSSLGQDAHLTACVHRWDRFYIDTVTEVLNGTWQSAQTWQGFAGDMVALAPLKSSIAPPIRQQVTEQQVLFLTEQSSPFTGPITDQQGVLRVAAGEVLSDPDQRQMDWWVAGVESDLP